jgi:hypothetical protein
MLFLLQAPSLYGLLFDPEDGGITILRNFGKFLQGLVLNIKEKTTHVDTFDIHARIRNHDPIV